MELQSRFTGCLLGLALGDAMGAPFEGSLPGDKSLAHLPPLLRYTDDTEMAMGIAQSLCVRKGFDPEDMARRFVENFDPRRGYGPGTISVLSLIKRGAPWREANRAVFPQGSFGNGAAMRAAPIGLFYFRDAERLREVTFEASAITHDHLQAKEGALLITASVTLILQKKKKEDILGSLMSICETEEYREKLRALRRLLTEESPDVVGALGHDVLALNSVPTALYAFLRYGEDYLETVRFCLDLGGDTDTIAAMAGALAGASLGVEGLPTEYLSRLEGRDLLEDLSRTLLENATP